MADQGLGRAAEWNPQELSPTKWPVKLGALEAVAKVLWGTAVAFERSGIKNFDRLNPGSRHHGDEAQAHHLNLGKLGHERFRP
jgi:hypothetical protein|tara:strand:+ start:11779 stop:12027 length:249 start_codon:yes stop_codon:yes gene_type:complete